MRAARALMILGVLSSLSWLSGVARAEIESELVRRGVTAYDNLEYDRAVKLFQQALGETLTREERVVTWRTLGFAYVGLDQVDKAREAFDELLRIDPNLELERTVSPRIRAVFVEQQKLARQRAAEEAERHPPPPPPPPAPAPHELELVPHAATAPPPVEVQHRRPAWKSPVLWGVLGGALAAAAIVTGVVVGTSSSTSQGPAQVTVMLH
jgi:tetratricopeptide (TPR) repeat protein